jgi:hypothetical protein
MTSTLLSWPFGLLAAMIVAPAFRRALSNPDSTCIAFSVPGRAPSEFSTVRERLWRRLCLGCRNSSTAW